MRLGSDHGESRASSFSLSVRTRHGLLLLPALSFVAGSSRAMTAACTSRSRRPTTARSGLEPASAVRRSFAAAVAHADSVECSPPTARSDAAARHPPPPRRVSGRRRSGAVASTPRPGRERRRRGTSSSSSSERGQARATEADIGRRRWRSSSVCLRRVAPTAGARRRAVSVRTRRILRDHVVVPASTDEVGVRPGAVAYAGKSRSDRQNCNTLQNNSSGRCGPRVLLFFWDRVRPSGGAGKSSRERAPPRRRPPNAPHSTKASPAP